METAFFSDLPAGFNAGEGRGCGRADVGAGDGGAVLCTLDGARSPLFGVLDADFEGVAVARLLVLFRVLATGSAGSAIFGGPLEGRDGRGSVVVMMTRATGRYAERFVRMELLARRQ